MDTGKVRRHQRKDVVTAKKDLPVHSIRGVDDRDVETGNGSACSLVAVSDESSILSSSTVCLVV